MHYILMDYVNNAGWPELARSTSRNAGWAPIAPTWERSPQPGVLRSSHSLRPSPTATTVRVAAGKAQVLDGPYADTKEQLGGFHIIDVPDLDAAIAWAARSPTALHGVVEVRPLWSPAPC